jgi:hypothetical protein
MGNGGRGGLTTSSPSHCPYSISFSVDYQHYRLHGRTPEIPADEWFRGLSVSYKFKKHARDSRDWQNQENVPSFQISMC